MGIFAVVSWYSRRTHPAHAPHRMSSLPTWLAGRLQPEPATSRMLYNTLFKHSSTYMATLMITATAAGLGFDYVMNTAWEMNSKGKLWKDVKGKLAEADDD